MRLLVLAMALGDFGCAFNPGALAGLGGLGGIGAGLGGLGGLGGAGGGGGFDPGSISAPPGQAPLGFPPSAGQVPAGVPGAPGSTDPLAGGGSAIPPTVGAPGSADLAPPSGLGADDYDFRRDLRTVQIPQKTQWTNGAPGANLPYVLDVMRREARPDMQTSNLGTWVHETTHGIHAGIRNGFVGRGTSSSDATEAVYIENGVGAYFPNPGTRQSLVLPLLPQAAQSVSRVNTYLRGSQASSWPLASHLFDEWGAYINGGRAAVEIARAGLWRGGNVDEVDGMMDFVYFCTGVCAATSQSNAQGLTPAMKAVFACEAERSAKWVGAGLQIPQFRGFHAAQLFRHFQSSPDNQRLRAFLVQWLGKGWTKRVFGFEA